MVASSTKVNEHIEQLELHNEELTNQLQVAQRKITILQNQIEQLLRRVYGRRSEKLDPNQLMFDNFVLDAIEQPAPEPLAELSEAEEPAPREDPYPRAP